ncbi:MAG: DUF1971 domain-containing protein [Chloroflexi bacterium]|nr:DUF1971 domain-containing protein [Chloroflexota bacterium]MCY3939314.1 DUF1971 domain-containing protein [Chloroflexota bacterium]
MFDEDTIPDALRRKHALAADRWGVLHVLEGSLRFVDLESCDERLVSAPDRLTINPEVPHRVEVDGSVRCRIDFFRDFDATSSMRTPGAFADADVQLSFQRCDANGGFAEVFYRTFLSASPEIPPYFAATDFDRQRRVLRDSVHLMVTRDVAEPEMRQAMERLGRAHGRGGRNILPKLYELWLDSVCQTVELLDPEWNDNLERKWRVRLRPGIQMIMARY